MISKTSQGPEWKRRKFLSGAFSAGFCFSAFSPHLMPSAVAQQKFYPVEEMVEIKVKRAIELAANSSGGVVRLPSGFLMVTEPLSLYENVILTGAGVGKTTIFSACVNKSHVILLTGRKSGLSQLTVDGNRQARLRCSPSGSHNIRICANEAGINSVQSQNSVWYGIGIGQRQTVENIELANLIIKDSGADGIDIKGAVGGASTVFAYSVFIDRFGQHPTARRKAGLDIRGQFKGKIIKISGVSSGGAGVRFRQGDMNNPNGLGGHNSSITNVNITGDGHYNLDRPSVGLAYHANLSTVDHAQISGMALGLAVSGENNQLRNARVAAKKGFFLFKRNNRSYSENYQIKFSESFFKKLS